MNIQSLLNPQNLAKARGLVSRMAGPAATAIGIGSGANVVSRSVTDENLSPGTQALAYAAGGLAGASKIPLIAKLAPNLALTGAGVTGLDLLQKRHRGYSMFDPKSVERVMGERVEQTIQNKAQSIADRWRDVLRSPQPAGGMKQPFQHSSLHELFGGDVHGDAARLARAYRDKWQSPNVT